MRMNSNVHKFEQKGELNWILKKIISQQYGIPCLPKRTSEAMAYVPFQQFDSPTYSPLQGLESGTMFPVLNKPFYGKKCGEGLD